MTTALALGPGEKETLLQRHDALFRGRQVDSWRSAALVLALFLVALFALSRMEITFHRLGLGLFELGHFLTLMVPPEVASWAQARAFTVALLESIAIALLGTLIAAAIALPLGFLASRNVMPAWLVRTPVRRFFDLLRGVDVLVWALVWINVVGLGPFAGILAIATADLGLIGKQFSETIETAGRREVEGVLSTGAGPVTRVRFGILPQVLPVMLGQVLYQIESNARSATVIGIVGAGGIGLYLSEMIRTLEWNKVSTLVLGLLVAVALIDAISTRIRGAWR
jgi:phosphonate transport system permease protein